MPALALALARQAERQPKMPNIEGMTAEGNMDVMQALPEQRCRSFL